MKKQLYPAINSATINRNRYPTLQDLSFLKTEAINEVGQLLLEINGLPSKQWIKSNELMRFLGVSSGTLQTLRNNTILPFTRIGGVIYYNTESVINMLEQHRQKALLP